MTRPPVIALLTDFGTEDSYVAEVKGAILSHNREIRIVDISHSVSPGDIRHTAYLLWRSHGWLPDDTVFAVVVDPGVGSDRKIVALQTSGYWFVAPDNGVLTMIADMHRFDAWEVSQSGKRESETFHGRDMIAPLCARLAMQEIEPADIGPAITELTKFDTPEVTASSRSIEGEVITVDRFGNAISNIPSESLSGLDDLPNARVFVDDKQVTVLGKTFSSAADGETVAYPGSAGLIEVAVNGGNLVERYSIKRGSRVRIVCDDS